MLRIINLFSISLLLTSCVNTSDNKILSEDIKPSESIDTPTEFEIPFEKYELDNGLDVILHVDRSDPVIAINLMAHVGSARERPGRTGFAHLFEHLLFLDSENLGYGGLDQMSTRIGGSGTNGFTTNDITTYFQSAPSDALEKLIWAEAEKIGYFIKTVTPQVLDKEREVVKNEKRQNVDLRPYGRVDEIISSNLYPKSHPYHWQVIGSLKDLQAASLEDVHAFYDKWYGPENVTLTLTGNFDPQEALRLVKKYFDEIAAREKVDRAKPRPIKLNNTQKLYYEDKLAHLPMLTLAWPAVQTGHKDSAALGLLAQYLSASRASPLYQSLVIQKGLSTRVDVYTDQKELAGEVYLSVTANEDMGLDDFLPVVLESFKTFEANGISMEELTAIKSDWEVDYLASLQSTLGKSISLSEANVLYGDPSYTKKEFEEFLRVTPQDIINVYTTYLKDKPFIALSAVPENRADLALSESKQIIVTEEKLDETTNEQIKNQPSPSKLTFSPTASQFDRSVEPDFGAAVRVANPEIWRSSLGNSIEIYGIESDEVPLVYFSLEFEAGQKFSNIKKLAVPRMTASMLNRGTRNNTAEEIERKLKKLGAQVSVRSSWDRVSISGSTLTKNFYETIALSEEILLEPRWDEKEFAIIKTATSNRITEQETDPSSIINRQVRMLRFTEKDLRRNSSLGTKTQLEKITLQDLKVYYNTYYAPLNAKLRVVGDIKETDVKRAFKSLAENWTTAEPLEVPSTEKAVSVSERTLYFYDIPGSSQTFIRGWHPSVASTHPDYPYLEAVNFLLGGSFTSILNNKLRVKNGYTYGASSGFSGGKEEGRFSVSTDVRFDATADALKIIFDELSAYASELNQEDLNLTRNALVRAKALNYETLSAKLGYLNPILTYGVEDDYAEKQLKLLSDMTLEDFRRVAETYIQPDSMIWLIGGDAETQLKLIQEMQMGSVTLLSSE